MIEVMTTTAHGVCKNCHGEIHLSYGDMSGPKWATWYHEANGKNTCPKAPVAEPIEETITDVADHS